MSTQKSELSILGGCLCTVHVNSKTMLQCSSIMIAVVEWWKSRVKGHLLVVEQNSQQVIKTPDSPR